MDDIASELIESRNWKHLACLGQSSFGLIISVEDPDKKQIVAVKISKVENELEAELWIRLLHPSIVPLFEVVETSISNIKAFVMPQYKTSLYNCLQGSSLVGENEVLEVLLKWLYQILCGLRYLHKLKLSHLDLKLDNVLLANAGNAVISDFGYLTTRSVVRCDHFMGMPNYWKPPELLDCSCSNLHVSQKLDVWCYGLIVLETLTRCGLHKYLRDKPSALEYPMSHVLEYIDDVYNKEDFLGNNVKKAYQLKECVRNIDELRNFIRLFLQKDPLKRLPVKYAINHEVLSPFNSVSNAVKNS